MNREQAERMWELAATSLEGLQYVNAKIDSGYFEQALPVLGDVLEAFLEIEASLVFLDCLTGESDLVAAGASLREGFDWVALLYEQQDNVRLFQTFEMTLLPRYRAWQQELHFVLEKYWTS